MSPLLLEVVMKFCPHCAEEIDTGAVRCPHCSNSVRAGRWVKLAVIGAVVAAAPLV